MQLYRNILRIDVRSPFRAKSFLEVNVAGPFSLKSKSQKKSC